MGLLARLFGGGKPDPTAGWPVGDGLPAVDPATQRFGFMRLGDPIESANERENFASEFLFGVEEKRLLTWALYVNS